jgi:catechol 2,3-dioxygenase-like lactoylglutathione lyase family enzyme
VSFRSLKVVVRCTDLDASRAFYTEVLGLAVAEQWEEPQGRGLVVSVSDSALIEVYEMSAADPRFREPVPNDKIDIQIRTGSVDDWAARLHGRWPFEGPEDLPWGQRWIRLRDPDGLLIAIYSERS